MIVSARLTSTGACFRGKEANDSDARRTHGCLFTLNAARVINTVIVAFCNVIVLLARALRMKSTRRVPSEKCSVVDLLRDCKKSCRGCFYSDKQKAHLYLLHFATRRFLFQPYCDDKSVKYSGFIVVALPVCVSVVQQLSHGTTPSAAWNLLGLILPSTGLNNVVHHYWWTVIHSCGWSSVQTIYKIYNTNLHSYLWFL